MEHVAVTLLFLLSFTNFSFSDQCLDKLTNDVNGFKLDAEKSIKDGASFLSRPDLTREEDCVSTCCGEQRCNTVMMEQEDEDHLIKSCSLFDCMNKLKNVCHFVKSNGYKSITSQFVFTSSNSRLDKADQPPVANAGPDLVALPHEPVTLNGLQSSDDQGIVNYYWHILGDYPHVKIERGSSLDQIIVSNLSSGMYKFQLHVTDTGGLTNSTTINVLVLTKKQSEHPCMAPFKSGPCRGSFPRWHFNAASGKCEQFSFGGCRENRNNYLTLKDCNKVCKDSEHCMAPIEYGRCRGAFPRWYFNAVSGKCEQFFFGGCNPNRNNYLTLEECNKACKDSEQGSPSGRSISLPEDAVIKSGTSINIGSERQAGFVAMTILVIVSVHGC